MRNFHRLAEGVPVAPLMHAIARQPDLWNQNRYRTTYDGTPHVDVDDILLRFSATKRTRDPSDLEAVQNDGAPVWYEANWKRLPEARPIVQALMHAVGGYALGRLLVTRLPPGGRILPHTDDKGAYVHQPDIQRYHVVLQGLPGSLFRCGEETVQMLTGETYWFNAFVEHEVLNNSADDRVHLLVDLQVMP